MEMGLRSELYNILKEVGVQSFITLTYPAEMYPENGQVVKMHLDNFIRKLRTLKGFEAEDYFYVYERQEQDRLHIHLVTTGDFSNRFYKLKEVWAKIIGKDSAKSALNYRLIDQETLDNLINYLLKITDNRGLMESVVKLLGSGSRLFGGSAKLQPFLKKLRGHALEVSPMFRAPKATNLSLEDIRLELLQEYGKRGVSEELLDRQLSYELVAYEDALTIIQLTDIEKFLSNSKSEISKGYLKFYKFITKVIDENYITLRDNLTNWHAKFERKSAFVRDMQVCLGIGREDLQHHQKEIFRKSLSILVRNALRGVDTLTTYKQLGKVIFRDLEGNPEVFNEEETNLFRAGSFIFNIMRYSLQGKIDFTEVADYLDDDISQEDLVTYLEGAQKSILVFDFNKDWLYNLVKDGDFTKTYIGSLLSSLPPMIVEPRDWKLGITVTDRDSHGLYNAQTVHSGGLLLNGYYLHKFLQKRSKLGHEHKLAVSKESIETINKIQKAGYTVNRELLKLLQTYKHLIPDIKSEDEMKSLMEQRLSLKRSLLRAFNERRTYVKEKYDLVHIQSKIKQLFYEIKELDGIISKHGLFERVLSSCGQLQHEEKFYYSYEADFRMRLYPQQYELSPQASKLSRALLKFYEETEFDPNEFALYATRLYIKQYEFDEPELLTLYNLRVLPILEEFIVNKESAISRIFAEAGEPYIFLAACVEYSKYKECRELGKPYKTGFFIVLDCSGSGPQIVSLLFLLDEFSEFLNLKISSGRKDFYVSVIRQFFKKKAEDRNNVVPWLKEGALENREFLMQMRSICKRPIMTQLYGVSYRKFTDDIVQGFHKGSEVLSKFIAEDYEKFKEEFIAEFWPYLRSLQLFKLREFFSKINAELKEVEKPLSWKVLGSGRVVVDYQRFGNRRLDFRDSVLGRKTMLVQQTLKGRNYYKQTSSAQANFIHSIDAYVSLYILSHFEGSIFPNHDSWGVNMRCAKRLQELIREVYYKIANNNEVYKTFVADFTKLLNDLVGPEAAESFRQYCETSLEIGKFDPKELIHAKFLVYYGS